MKGTIIRDVEEEIRIPIIGKIKIGQKTETGGTQSLDHFRAAGDYAHYFHEAYGERPTSIIIMFLSDDYSKSCYERYELRKGPKLYAYGDGKDFRVYNEERDEYVNMSKDDAKDRDILAGLHRKLNSKWEVVLDLKFIIPAISGVFGIWSLSTKGEKSSIPAIKGAFAAVHKFAGRVTGIPFDLSVKKVVSNKPESKSKYPVIQLVPNVSQGHLEKVRDYISNRDFIGLLTEEKIDEMAMDNAIGKIEYKEGGGDGE